MTSAPEEAPLGEPHGDGEAHAMPPRQAGSEPADRRAGIPALLSLAKAALSAGWRRVASERHGVRFTVFAAIGASVFALGLGIQITLVQYLHFAAIAAYIIQGVVSVELNFLLNWRLTWRDRNVPFLRALWRFNTQKALSVLINQTAYAVIVGLGVQYIVANIGLTAVFTPLNYLAGHYWSFKARAQRAAEAGQVPARADELLPSGPLPTVSAVIPCKNNPGTIRATIDALLHQDYPALEEIIVVGDVNDPTWTALADIADPRLSIVEQEPTGGQRDPNVKRDKGIRKSRSDLIALVDSDIVPDADWLSWAVVLLIEQGGGLVAGGMRSVHDTFWGRFVDRNILASKTPRLPRPYNVTAENFGKHGFKPPITANAVFTRQLYQACALDVTWSYGYEDYEWFWRLTKQEHRILFSGKMTAAHHHRTGFWQLGREYRRSAHGCAHFIRAHGESPLARKRLLQATLLPLSAAIGLVALVVAAWTGHLAVAGVLLAAVAALLLVREITNTHSVEAVAYPVVGLALCAVFTGSLLTTLGRLTVAGGGSVGIDEPPAEAKAQPSFPRPVRSPRYLPLAGILCLQAVVSLSLVWSNTVFGQEASYLVQGRLEWANWLHGSPVPAFTGPGAAQIYPPLGALANGLGGLAGARILSLFLMLGATALLYRVAQRLFGDWAAIIGAALWAVSAPVLNLTLATSDPLSCFLVAAAAWATVQVGFRRRNGELVALVAALLALASAATFSFAVMIPAVVAFAFFVWQPTLGTRKAIWFAGWLAGGIIVFTAVLFSLLHLWPDAIYSSFTGARTNSGADAISVVRSVWAWEGLMLVLAAAGVAEVFTSAHDRSRRLLLVTLFASALLVPIYQVALGTGSWLLDQRMPAGTWFLAMGAGYAAATLAPLLRWKGIAAGAAVALFLVYPVVTGTWYARSSFREWPNVSTLVARMRPLVDGDPGRIVGTTTGDTAAVLQYYLLRGDNWQRWQATNGAVPSIANGNVSFVVLELSGSFDTAQLSEGVALYPSKPLTSEILRLASGTGQLSLARELVHSPNYRIRLTSEYETLNAASRTGIFVVWQRATGQSSQPAVPYPVPYRPAVRRPAPHLRPPPGDVESKEGPQWQWVEDKTGSEHPRAWLARHHDQVLVGPHGSFTIVRDNG